MSEVVSTHSHDLLEQVTKMLREEKWTRTAIDNYSKQSFTNLDSLVEKAKTEDLCDALQELCVEHLNQSPKSVTALYIASMITYEHDIIDDSYIFELVFLFKENKKWNIVEHLCQKILTYGENKLALKMLSEVYSELNKKAELLHIWERLAKVDYENGDAPKKLAQHYEKNEQIETSISLYKMALKRFAKTQHNMKIIEEIWVKLLDWIPEQTEFFFSIHNEIVKYNPEKAEHLLFLLLPKYKETKDYQKIILLLQRLVQHNSTNKVIREELIKTYSNIHRGHKHLENYIEKSGLADATDLQQAMKDFEKYIVFDTGSFVYHRSWSLGKITECDEKGLHIDFEKKPNHRMSFKIALTSLKILSEEHIWIQKRKSLKKLQELSTHKAGIEELLGMILRSYNGQATMREIKSEILDIIPPDGWTQWWVKAKQIIKTSTVLGNSHNKRDLYFFRKKPLSLEEEAYSIFTSSHSFDKKLTVFFEYLKNSDDFETEGFQQMLAFFVDTIHSRAFIDTKVIKSFLLLRRLKRDKPDTAFELKLNSYELLQSPQDLMEVYNDMQDSEYKKDILLRVIQKNDPQWPEHFVKYFLEARISKAHNIIVEELFKHDPKTLQHAFTQIISTYRVNPEHYFWLVKYLLGKEELLQHTGYSDYKRLIFNLFYCLDILNKELSEKKPISNKNNRKLLTQIIDFFLKDNVFTEYIQALNKSDARKILAIIKGLTVVDEQSCFEMIQAINARFKDLIQEQEPIETEHHQFLVTRSSYERKQRELQHILEVEIPENSKAIGIAKELGDLRENADYIAALEHQKQIQQQASTLTQELSRVHILTTEDVDETIICPGVEVKLKNLDTQKTEQYIILGEWESDMEQGIISYKSPFGKVLLGHRINDTLQFQHEHIHKSYHIEAITKAFQFLT